MCLVSEVTGSQYWAFETHRASIGRCPSGPSGNRAPSGHRAIGRRFVVFLDYRIQCPSGAKIPSGFCLHRARYRRDKIHFAACNQDHRARRPIGPIGRGSPSGSSGIQLHRAHRAIGRHLTHRALHDTPLKNPSGKRVHRALHRARETIGPIGPSGALKSVEKLARSTPWSSARASKWSTQANGLVHQHCLKLICI